MFIRDTSLAQYFTPLPISKIMQEWLDVSDNHSVLEPAVGTGNLLTTIKNKNIFAYDKDKRCLDYVLENREIHAYHQDYLLSESNQYDRIISNPPYLKYNQYDLTTVKEFFQNQYGILLPGNINAYQVFVIKGLFELSQHGKAVYLIPSDWYAPYRESFFQNFLMTQKSLKYIVLYDENTPVFDDNMSSACLLMFDKQYEGEPIVKKTVYQSSQTLNDIMCLPDYHKPVIDDGMILLSDVMHVKRGIATGANEWFVGDLNKFNYFPYKVLTPCITKASDINQASIQDRALSYKSDFDKYIISPDQSKICQDYIALGESQGLHQRYLTRKRKQWYSINLPRIPDAFINVFTRKEFYILENILRAQSLSCFHYVYLKDTIDIYKYNNFIMGDDFHRSAENVMKKYGGGLWKLEPGMIMNMKIPDIRLS